MTGNGPADACSAENVPTRDDSVDDSGAAGPRFNLLDFIGALFTESRDELGDSFTHRRQAAYVLGRLAGSADVAELVATQLGDIDTTDDNNNGSAEAYPAAEAARRLLSGLIVAANPAERWVRAAEDHDLSDADLRALQAILAVHVGPRGMSLGDWEGALCCLIVLANAGQRRRLAAAYPSWIAWADVIDDRALLARLLAATAST